jgi:hypothetical protein
VFENRALIKIVEPVRDKVTGDWMRLHNEELHGLYSSPNNIWVIKSRRMGWMEHLARTGEKRNAYRVFGRPRCRWEDDIKVDAKERV